MWDPYAEIESTMLPNGLTVHAAEWRGRPWEAVGFVIHSGAEHDPIGKEGLSHFVEHLVSRNSGYTRREARRLFEENGGQVNLGETGYPSTQFSFWASTEPAILSEALSFFGNTLLFSKLENRIEEERRIIISEFHRRHKHPIILQFALEKRDDLYSGCWLGRYLTPLGAPESILKISKEDLQLSYDRHYTPANMSIIGVGGLSLETLAKFISESPLAARKDGSRTSLPSLMSEAPTPTTNRRLHRMSDYLKGTASFGVGSYESVAAIATPKKAALGALRKMLQEILTDEIRERWTSTYHVDVDLHDFRYFHQFQIFCSHIEEHALGDIEKIVDLGIASIEGKRDLFERMKKQRLAEMFMSDLSARAMRNIVMDELADSQKISSYAEDFKEVEAVSWGDVLELLPLLHPLRRWTRIELS